MISRRGNFASAKLIGFALVVTICILAASAASSQEKARKFNSNLIHPSRPFTSDAIVSNEELELLSTIEVNVVENGVKDGVTYRIFYSDGSGTFAGKPENHLAVVERPDANWNVGCKKDAMDDSRMCHLNRGDLWVFAYTNGRRVVSIGDDIFPGTSVAIRIDGNTAIRSASDSDGDFGPQGSKAAIAQMKSGDRVSTRYVDWPYQTNVDSEYDLYGFSQAYEYLEWALTNSN